MWPLEGSKLNVYILAYGFILAINKAQTYNFFLMDTGITL